ncbi:MAG: hypothetical protein MJZ33_13405 [Paludibacteraceae bacterium]|nr:hypothetical protein [Paludibacteraceae bacterium]
MKKILFLALVALSLFSCSKEVEMERASYTWVEGDSIPKRSFIMSVATIFDLDSTGVKQKLECQVTLGDSTDANLIGSKLDLDVIFDNGQDGTYKIGSNCEGTARYIKCRPGVETNVTFNTVVYTLTEGQIILKNLTANHDQVLLDVDLKGSAQVAGEPEYEEKMEITEEGDTIFVQTPIETFETKEIRINGEITALR